jgi:hypothetical protein
LLASPAANHAASAATAARFQCRVERIQSNSASFDRTVAAFEPDVVLFDRLVMEEQFAWRVRQSAPRALRCATCESACCFQIRDENSSFPVHVFCSLVYQCARHARLALFASRAAGAGRARRRRRWP